MDPRQLKPTTTLPQEAVTTISGRIEEMVAVVADPSVRPLIFSYLRWAIVPFRLALLRHILTHLPNYLRGPRQYVFNDHFNNLKHNLQKIASDNGAELVGQLNCRYLKGFLVICVNVAYHYLYPEECKECEISMDLFKSQYVNKAEFANMCDEDWRMALRFRNLLAVTLLLIPPRNNKLMLTESCALMIGINKCFQGSNTGREVKRLHRVMDDFVEVPVVVPGFRGSLGGLGADHEIVFQSCAQTVSSLIDDLQTWVSENPDLSFTEELTVSVTSTSAEDELQVSAKEDGYQKAILDKHHMRTAERGITTNSRKRRRNYTHAHVAALTKLRHDEGAMVLMGLNDGKSSYHPYEIKREGSTSSFLSSGDHEDVYKEFDSVDYADELCAAEVLTSISRSGYA